MTGNAKLDIGLFIAVVLLQAVSKAVGMSKKYKGNGIIQLLGHFVKAGAAGVLAEQPASGLTEKLVVFAEPAMERMAEAVLDGSPEAAPGPPNQVQSDGKNAFPSRSGLSE